MSLLPVMLRSMGWQLRQHNELMKHFLRQDMKGFFSPEEIKFLTSPFPNLKFERVDFGNNNLDAAEVEAVINKDGFKLNIDVEKYEPDEVTVKTIDNMIVIEGKHEERPDENGSISRQFVRKYAVPEGFNIKNLVSTLSSDGILTVKAPPLNEIEGNKERVVKIEQTGECLRQVKSQAEKKESGGAKTESAVGE